MSKYEEDNVYIDGEERRPRLIAILFLAILLVILLIFIISCSVSKGSSNIVKTNGNYLSFINVSNSTLSPEFRKDVYSYDVLSDKEEFYISCEAENKNAKTEGCNKTVRLNNTTKSLERYYRKKPYKKAVETIAGLTTTEFLTGFDIARFVEDFLIAENSTFADDVKKYLEGKVI